MVSGLGDVRHHTPPSHQAACLNTVTVPQLGEGLRTVRLTAILKQPGDSVELDEPLFEVETAKANVLVESSYAGVVVEWYACVGDEVDVYGALATIRGADTKSVEGDGEVTPAHQRGRDSTDAQTAEPNLVAPRVRAFAKQHGLTDAQLVCIPTQSGKLTESDVLRFIGGDATDENKAQEFEEFELSSRQQTLNRCALRGEVHLPLPATLTRILRWPQVATILASVNDRYPSLSASEFQVLAFCAARAAADHSKLRSTLMSEGTVVRRFKHVNLGFAVPLPDDELTTAVVRAADSLDFPEFVRQMKSQMRRARRGEPQVDDTTTLLLTSLAGYGVVDAIPVLVPPAVATLFIGSPYGANADAVANLTLTFDHRLINGVGAARFLQSIEREIEDFSAAPEAATGRE